MPRNKEIIALHKEHDIVPTQHFASLEQYCVYLMYLQTYQGARSRARAVSP